MHTPTRSDPYAPITFSDGRVYNFQVVQGFETSQQKRVYLLHLELMERDSQHLHTVRLTIHWAKLSGDKRRPSGETLLKTAREFLTEEMATWRYPEGQWSMGTLHEYALGLEPERPI